ncbi:MAG: hypothetical protein LBI56_03395 [Puniceicoccales bacterium]|jgi:hypothetical protein|nr:hypothetical protein [Puniceicoccales bacterium]
MNGVESEYIIGYLYRSEFPSQWSIGEGLNGQITRRVHFGRQDIFCPVADPELYLGKMFLFFDGKAYWLDREVYRVKELNEVLLTIIGLGCQVYGFFGQCELVLDEVALGAREIEKLLYNLARTNVVELDSRTVKQLINTPMSNFNGDGLAKNFPTIESYNRTEGERVTGLRWNYS